MTKKLELTIDMLEKIKKRNFSNNNNDSNIYEYNDMIIKVLNPNLREKRYPIIKELLDIEATNCIKIDQLVYFKDKFVGYTMLSLKGYDNLNEFVGLTNDSLNENEKHSVIKKIIQTHRSLSQKGFLYYDLNLDNIMIKSAGVPKKDSICFVDMDSVTKIEKNNAYFNLIQAIGYRNLLLTVLSLIVDENLIEGYIEANKRNELGKFSNAIKTLVDDTNFNNIIDLAFNDQLLNADYLDKIDNYFEKKQDFEISK